MNKQNFISGIIGGLVVLIFGGILLFATDSLNFNFQGTKDNEQVADVSPHTSESVALDISTNTTEVVEQVSDAVVSVVNMQDVSSQSGRSILDYYFNPYGNNKEETDSQKENQYQTAGEGSGVIYKVEGDTAYVVTNNHVIDGQDRIELIFKDGQQVPAELVGTDPWTDLAVLSIDAEHVKTTIEFVDSDLLTVGEPAIAIGSPLGSDFATTVTQGIISATDRSMPQDIDGDGQADWTTTVIQTDAAINPGNSGGALVNAAGQLIGINQMKVASENVEGMGFAIPANEVKRITAQLESQGEVIRPSLGVKMVDVNRLPLDYQRNELGLKENQTTGVVVVEVTPKSAADIAGIEAGDVIIDMDDEEIQRGVDLRQVLYSRNVGENIDITILRDGQEQTITVELIAATDSII